MTLEFAQKLKTVHDVLERYTRKYQLPTGYM